MSFWSKLFGWCKKKKKVKTEAVPEHKRAFDAKYAYNALEPEANEEYPEDGAVRLDALEAFRASGAFFDALITCEGAELKFFLENGDGSYIACFMKAAPEALAAYTAGLTSNGYEQLQSRRVQDSDNLFEMYGNDTHVISVFYVAHKKQIRVIVETREINGYCKYVNENTANDVCEPLLLQVGCGPDGTKLNAGMCYIFRLSNGEFVIFDGGHDDDRYPIGENGQRLYQKLKEYAPDPEHIVIAAWLITHPHADHVGPLSYFIKHYLDDPTYTVKNVLVNNPSDEVLMEDVRVGVEKPKFYRGQYAELSRVKGTVIQKTHAGQALQFGTDAELEILYTHELRLPGALYGANNLSIISRMTVCGQTFLLPGDSKAHANRMIEHMYGSRLHSDFYQTPHHGMGPNTLTLAEVVDPRWVLWPVGEGRVEIAKGKPHNAYLIGESNHVEAIFLGKFLTHEFKLPFDGTNYTVTPNEIINPPAPTQE